MRPATVAIVLLALAATGCGGSEPPIGPIPPAGRPLLTLSTPLAAVGDEVRAKFQAGGVTCDTTWSVLALEEGSLARPVADGLGSAKISPDVPGTYVVEARGCGAHATGSFVAFTDENRLEKQATFDAWCSDAAVVGGELACRHGGVSFYAVDGTKRSVAGVPDGSRLAASGDLLAASTTAGFAIVDLRAGTVAYVRKQDGGTAIALGGPLLVSADALSAHLFRLDDVTKPLQIATVGEEAKGVAVLGNHAAVVTSGSIIVLPADPTHELSRRIDFRRTTLREPVFAWDSRLVLGTDAETAIVDLEKPESEPTPLLPFHATAIARVGDLLALSTESGVYLVDAVETPAPRVVGRLPPAYRLAGDATTLFTVPAVQNAVTVWRLR